MTKEKSRAVKFIFWIFMALFLAVCLGGYFPQDGAWNTANNPAETKNYLGSVGHPTPP